MTTTTEDDTSPAPAVTEPTSQAGGAELVTVVVPFAYDLGGRVTDLDALRAALASLDDAVGDVTVDQGAVRSWNLSYLATHPPVLRCELAPGVADMGQTAWSSARVLRVYTWLGVATLEYTFRPPAPDVAVELFYDQLVAWKNRDYFRYLHDEGALRGPLVAHTGWAVNDSDVDLHASLVVALRQDLERRGALEPRPRRYAFHDFRPCFVVPRSTLGPDRVERLLMLSDRSGPGVVEEAVHRTTLGDVSVSSTGWSTVVEHGDDVGVRTVLDMVQLVHAQWFLCQTWIATYDADAALEDVWEGPERAEELARTQLAVARDLVEVDSLDLMLKDPALLRVARTLGSAFGLVEHRAATERRLRVLDDYSRQLAEATQARDAQRLQILFSLSAAGTIAGLIPAIASLQSSWYLTAVTVVVGVALWLGFAINFAVLLRRRNRASRSARLRRTARRVSLWRTAPV